MNTQKDNSASDSSQGNTTSSEPWRMQAEDWERRYATDNFIWSVKPNSFLQQHAQQLTPGRAIDLAAGECRNAVWLARQGWSVEAVDFAQQALQKGLRLARANEVEDRIRLVAADLNDFVPTEQAFELVTLIYLQLPWDELAPIIQRAARAVAPGGTFLLIAHHTQNLTRGYGGPQHAEVLYSAEQVAALLAPELLIERAEQLQRPVSTDNGIRYAIDCLVRAKRI